MRRRHDWLFSAERVLAKPMSGLSDSYSGHLQFVEIPDNDVCHHRTTLEVNTSDMDWLNSEVHEWLATKTTGVALIGSGGSDGTEARGFQLQRTVLTW